MRWERSLFLQVPKRKMTISLQLYSILSPPEAMKAFAGHEELKAKRAAAGAILETTVVTPMSSESFTR